jgi:hemerythrin
MTQEEVQWHSSYSVGIKLIDDQHQELIRMTNALFRSCLQGDKAAREFFRKVIRSALDYIKFHFSTEEKIFILVNYPLAAVHKKEHEGFVIEVIKQAKDFEEGRKFVPNAFARFLKNWVLSHIAVSDKKYAEYIQQWALADGRKNMPNFKIVRRV